MRGYFSTTPTQLFKLLYDVKFNGELAVDLTFLSATFDFPGNAFAEEERQRLLSKLNLARQGAPEKVAGATITTYKFYGDNAPAELTIDVLRARLAAKMGLPDINGIAAFSDENVRISCATFKLDKTEDVQVYYLYVWEKFVTMKDGTKKPWILGRVTTEVQSAKEINSLAVKEIAAPDVPNETIERTTTEVLPSE